MKIENLTYPFIGFLTCENRNCCSLNLGHRGPCGLVAKHEGRGVPMEAKNPREMRNKLLGHEKLAPCRNMTKCELVDKDGDIPRITQEELF